MRALTIACTVLLAAGCTPLHPQTSDEMSSSSVSVKTERSASPVLMQGNNAVYTDFQSDVIGNGQRAVLFFYAPWCPYCRTHDEELKAWYDSQELPISTYRVDYDSSLSLRSRYGVLSQHTFVLIDGDGNQITSITNYPSDEAVISLIKTP